MYLGAKRRYINTLPFLSFSFPTERGTAAPHFYAHVVSAHAYCGEMVANLAATAEPFLAYWFMLTQCRSS